MPVGHRSRARWGTLASAVVAVTSLACSSKANELDALATDSEDVGSTTNMATTSTTSPPSTSSSTWSESGSSTGGEVQVLCDGSPEARLVWTSAIAIEGGGFFGEIGDPAEAIMWENGTTYFYVTGTCEFHVLGNKSRFTPNIAGSLTPAQAAELSADLHFDEWPNFYGMSISGPPLDGGMRTLLGPGGYFLLGSACDPYTPDLEGCPEPFASIEVSAHQWWEKLDEFGEPASGPMRVAAVLEEPPGYTGPADWEPWPLQRPLADFVLEANAPIMAGQGVLLDDPDDVATMRAFRESFTAQFGSQDTIRALYIEDEGQHYLVYVRDTAPVEDENGLVPWLDGEL